MKDIRVEVVGLLVAAALVLGLVMGAKITTAAFDQVNDQVRQEVSVERERALREAGRLDPDEVRMVRTFSRILWRESSLRPCVTGDHDKPFQAFGPAQFQERTFEAFREEARMPWLRYTVPEHQLILTWWAVKNGKERHWSVVR